VPSLVTDFLLFFPFSTYHDFLPCSVNIFRLEICASFLFNTMYHESTYHDFLPFSVNIFRLEIGASFFFFLIQHATNQYRPTIPSSTLTLFISPSRQSTPTPYIPLTSYHSSSRKYSCLRCLFRSPSSSSTYTALAPYEFT